MNCVDAKTVFIEWGRDIYGRFVDTAARRLWERVFLLMCTTCVCTLYTLSSIRLEWAPDSLNICSTQTSRGIPVQKIRNGTENIGFSLLRHLGNERQYNYK